MLTPVIYTSFETSPFWYPRNGRMPLFLQNSKQITSLLQQADGEVDAFETRFKLYKAEQSQQPQAC